MGWDGRWTIFLTGILDWMDFFCLGISRIHHGSKILGLNWMWTFVFDFFWLEELERGFCLLGISPPKKWFMWKIGPQWEETKIGGVLFSTSMIVGGVFLSLGIVIMGTPGTIKI